MIKQDSIEFQSNLYTSTNPTRRWIHQQRRDWIKEKLHSTEFNYDSILEIGTGCGIYTSELTKLFMNVTTIDINSNFVNSIKITTPAANALVADIQTWECSDRYDVALMSEVLEHVSSPTLALSNIYQKLKPGGYFILTTPNKYSTVELTARLLKVPFFATLARMIYGEPVDELGHISLRTKTQLVLEIKSIGFQIIDNKDISFYLPVVAEVGGNFGKTILEFLEKRLIKSIFFRQLLWTQCYILRRP